MDKKEMHLEQVAAKIEEFEVHRAVPLYEIFAAFVAIGIAIMLMIAPALLQDDRFLYVVMLDIMPQTGWAISFVVAGVLSAMSLLAHWQALRVFSLLAMAGMYGVLAVCYGIGFPNIGMVVSAVMAIFCVLSVPLVKFTSLDTRRKRRG